jgi:hypothetical protein
MKRIDPPDLTFSVETYASYNGEEMPRSFIIRGRTYRVIEVIDRWYGKNHIFFRLLADDSYRYVLRQEFEKGTWELVMREDKSEKSIT